MGSQKKKKENEIELQNERLQEDTERTPQPCAEEVRGVSELLE